MTTHRAIAITAIRSLEVIDLPTPTVEPDEVLVHVRYVALTSFDAYQLDNAYALSPTDYPHPVGIASAGFVKAVGANVKDLKTGDRVATYNLHESKNKGAQEYAVVPRFLVAKIPEPFPLHEAASMPDNYTTAMYTVFGGPGLALPIPPSLVPPSNVPNRPAVDVSAPVLVYGAGSSSGQFFVQALSLAGFTDIFAVASSHRHEFLRSLGATQCFDYRTPDFVSHIRSAVALIRHGRFVIAVDPIATRRSVTLLSELLAAPASPVPARLAVLLPYKDGETVTNEPDSAMHRAPPPWLGEVLTGKNVEVVSISSFEVGKDPFSRENLMPVILPRLLENGAIRANPVRLIKEGSLLENINVGLDLLRNNKVSGEKIVVDLQADA